MSETTFEPLSRAQTEGSAPETESTSFSPLTLDRAKQLAAEAVAEMGAEYVYTNPYGVRADGVASDVDIECYYVHGDVPGCIVGHILYRHDEEMFDQLNSQYEGEDVAALPEEWFTQGVQDFLQVVQARQDNGTPWGVALEYALTVLDEPTGEN